MSPELKLGMLILKWSVFWGGYNVEAAKEMTSELAIALDAVKANAAGTLPPPSPDISTPELAPSEEPAKPETPTETTPKNPTGDTG